MYIPTGKELIDPFKVLEEGGIREGMKVADFGCGTLGHYVFAAAKLVGSTGKVYAIDILKSVLNGIESRMKMEGTTNVEMIWGDMERINGIKLPDGALDMGLVINNLFLSKHKDMLIKEPTRMVRSGGTVVIADWKPAGVGFGPDPSVRVSMDEAKKLALEAGLVIEKEFVPGPYHYGFVCRKP
jgi:ubiquinone/menaquinone biosynthesis C-methylase UbiE